MAAALERAAAALWPARAAAAMREKRTQSAADRPCTARRGRVIALRTHRPTLTQNASGRMSDKPTGIANGLTNYGDRDFSLYLRRSFAQSMGYSLDMLKKPVIGIAYTPSGFNNCHRHFPELLDAVKRGVLAAGALPIAFPTISL